MKKIILASFFMLLTLGLNAQKKAPIIPQVRQHGGRLSYVTDERGNQLPDYSYCGYKASNESIPTLPIQAVVPCQKGDATASIQAALDYVSSLKPDAQGFRGAVLLEKGRYEITQSLWIKASGVVLRGSGFGEDGTELVSTLTDRTTMIRVKGEGQPQYAAAYELTDSIVPVGSMKITVPKHPYRVGDHILLQQKSTFLQASTTRPQARRMEIPSKVAWERCITAIDGNVLTLDAPVTYELSADNNGAEVKLLTWKGRIENVGVENMRMTSIYDQENVKDENHAWIAIAVENTRDAWVRRVEFRHFAGSAVFVAETVSRLTIEDCKSFDPISEIGGQRRYTFYIKGAQCLCQRIQAEYGYHDFAVGAYAQGPNAFVQCWSILPFGYSGTIESWTSGVLFDICCVDGEALRFGIPNPADAFDGWTAVNSTMWNSTASMVSCPKPQHGQNWAFGAWGGFNGKAYWYDGNNHMSPWSLFYAQWNDRMGERNFNEKLLIALKGGGTSTPEDAKFQNKQSLKPLIMLSAWIDSISALNPIDCRVNDPLLRTVWNQTKTVAEKESKLEIENKKIELSHGLLLRDGKIMVGTRRTPAWWRGSMDVQTAFDSHVVRYALGPEGYGVVDDLNEMTDNMVKRGVLVTDFKYALWYDRRRDDHERTSRINGDVRPPLYELPFARSGKGRAWDGLSQYDLTKWNNWYWNRLKQYADLADEKNLVLFYQHYFQHNIIEAGAHWADFPWRSVNNVNQTGFPEPTPYAGNKRVFMSEHFYDETHPARRELHRNYIRKCLDNFSETGSVIHFISAEYTGPLHFTQFWVDVIAQWEAETGKSTLVALSAPKNVQDDILNDPTRADEVDVIDIRYWYVNDKGEEYAPQGGLNLAPRQFSRIASPGKTSDEQIYRMVRQYREAYPEKAVIYSAETTPREGWAAFMAGASLCNLPSGLSDDFKQSAAQMQPIEASQWTMASAAAIPTAYMVYPDENNKIQVDLSSQTGTFHAVYIDLNTGELVGKPFSVKTGNVYKVDSAKGLLWLYR